MSCPLTKEFPEKVYELLMKSEDVLRRGRRWKGLNRVRDPHGENPLLVQRLTQGGIIERQIDDSGVHFLMQWRPRA